MIKELQERNKRRARRKKSIRKKVRGTSERPRLSVFKSNRHVSAQLIDDEKGVTVASAGTLSKETKAKRGREAARQVGVCIAELAKKKNIQHAVFDRGSNKYHGLLAEVASGARETGLQL